MPSRPGRRRTPAGSAAPGSGSQRDRPGQQPLSASGVRGRAPAARPARLEAKNITAAGRSGRPALEPVHALDRLLDAGIDGEPVDGVGREQRTPPTAMQRSKVARRRRSRRRAPTVTRSRPARSARVSASAEQRRARPRPGRARAPARAACPRAPRRRARGSRRARPRPRPAPRAARSADLGREPVPLVLAHVGQVRHHQVVLARRQPVAPSDLDGEAEPRRVRARDLHGAPRSGPRRSPRRSGRSCCERQRDGARARADVVHARALRAARPPPPRAAPSPGAGSARASPPRARCWRKPLRPRM